MPSTKPSPVISAKSMRAVSDIGFDRVPQPLSALARTKALPAESRGKEPTPFVKWAGGKRALLSQLVSHMPATFETYFEPFAGGAALFFAIRDRVSRALLSDSNLELVITYNVVRRDPEGLIALLEEHTRVHSHDYYYRVRRQRGLQDPVKIAARFIYLNKTCYNGLYRVNKSGQFNVPIGRYATVSVYDKENVVACHAALQRAQVEYRDFSTINARPKDFVYFDPPYQPIDETASFTKYTRSDFSEKDQTRLRDFAAQLAARGVYVMVSNSDTQFIRELYSSSIFKTSVVQAPRSVNCKPTRRGPVNELVITTY